MLKLNVGLSRKVGEPDYPGLFIALQFVEQLVRQRGSARRFPLPRL